MRELVDHIEGINVVLTPGRYNAAFFEHSSSMERAYDNAVVLRDELSSRTLSIFSWRWTAWRSMPEEEPLPTTFSRFWMTCLRSGAAWTTMWRMRNAAISSSAANTWNAWICICGWIIHTV